MPTSPIQTEPVPRKKITLTVRVSVLLILAVVLPLAITVLGSELVLRPTLLSQASTEQGNDAQSHAQAVDSMLIARVQNLDFLSQFFAIQKFLAGDEAYRQQALDELALGYHLDANYSVWSLFNPQGGVLLSYPAQPAPRGNYMVPPDMLARLQGSHKTIISDVYFDSTIHMAFIDIYTSITDVDGKMLGLGRSTLKLASIWTAVNNATNAAPGSYAMMIDGNGVRIAYTNRDITSTTQPKPLFQAIGPLPEQLQQRIVEEDLYGNSYTPVHVMADPVLAASQSSKESLKTFQFTPVLQDEPFQAVQATCKVVPWRYIVLRPVNTITQAANQQNTFLIVLALVITVLAAVAGLLLGRAITRPILRSVSSLSRNSEMLKKLSASEQVTANEQKWIVESSQSGLKTVEYYTGASGYAAHRLSEIGQGLSERMNRMDAQAIQQHLNDIVAAASYIEKATSYQEQSSRSLSTAIRITTQVTDQLVSGATSAAEASKQLEDVILELRQVIGG